MSPSPHGGPETTPARAELKARQAKAPPRYAPNSQGADRGLALARVIALPEALEQRFAAGALVFGEVGENAPDARTYSLADRNFLVVMTSGMMDFLYSVGRAMSGATIVWSDKGEAENVQALSMGAIVELTAQVFRQWRRHCQPKLTDLLKPPGRIDHATFPVTRPTREINEALVTSAELFMLAHEIGHVMLDLGLAQSALVNEELKADQIGLSLYLPAAIAQTKTRTAFAGAAFAVRVTGALANAGARFSRVYPPATERLEVLLDGMRAACPSERYFDEACTVLVSQLDFMDDIDRHIASAGLSNPLAAWQTRVRLIAVLQAVADDQRPVSEFTEMVALAARDGPAADLASAASTLRRYYAPEADGPGYLSEPTRLSMVVALIKGVESLGAELRKVFTD